MKNIYTDLPLCRLSFVSGDTYDLFDGEDVAEYKKCLLVPSPSEEYVAECEDSQVGDMELALGAGVALLCAKGLPFADIAVSVRSHSVRVYTENKMIWCEISQKRKQLFTQTVASTKFGDLKSCVTDASPRSLFFSCDSEPLLSDSDLCSISHPVSGLPFDSVFPCRTDHEVRTDPFFRTLHGGELSSLVYYLLQNVLVDGAFAVGGVRCRIVRRGGKTLLGVPFDCKISER